MSNNCENKVNLHDKWIVLKKRIESNQPTIKSKLSFKHLTHRQQQVADYLIKGHTNKQIAESLELEVVTIKLHVRNILKLLNVENRTQAALHLYEMKQSKKL